jgi:hypothetical protein
MTRMDGVSSGSVCANDALISGWVNAHDKGGDRHAAAAMVGFITEKLTSHVAGATNFPNRRCR